MHHFFRPPFYALASVSVAVLLSACGPSAPTQSAPPAPEVGIVTVTAQPLSLRTELAGRTVALQTAEIRPQVSGIIQKRLFSEGSTVKAGQALYQIDSATYAAAVNSAQAAVARAEATTSAAKLRAARQEELQKADAGTQQELEDAQATLSQSEADLKTAQAVLLTAQIDLERTRISAPISGRVDTSTVTAGALVTASQTTALTTVQQLDPMWVDIPQSSVDILKLRRQFANGTLRGGDLAIQLVLEDGSTYAHPGKLLVSGMTVNAGTGAVTLRAQIPNPDGLLFPGMYVRAVLDQATDPAALLVPQAGVTRNARGQATVLLVKKDGEVEQRDVQVAEAINNQWRVTGGLAAGDRLIVEGTGKVSPGQLVKAVPVVSTAAAGG